MERVRAMAAIVKRKWKKKKKKKTYGACEGDGSHGEDVRIAEQVPEPRAPRTQLVGAPENTAGYKITEQSQTFLKNPSWNRRTNSGRPVMQ